MITRRRIRDREDAAPGKDCRSPIATIISGVVTGLLLVAAVVETSCVKAEGVARIRPSETFPLQVRIATDDGGLIHGDVYGTGRHAVVLAHGGRFNKESWAPQAAALTQAGFRVLAINFRGYGESRGPGQQDVLSAPLYLDVLAAVRHLRDSGAIAVSAIGASMGGTAAASASAASPASLDRLILLGATPDVQPEALTVRKFYIMTSDDRSGAGPRLPGLQRHFDRAPEPKQLLLLDGTAHAQEIFGTEHSEEVLRDIIRFLREP